MNLTARTDGEVYEDLRRIDVPRLRRIIRMGAYGGNTRGLAEGRLKTGLVIVPRRFARDFREFCLRNPKACPLVAVGRIGNPFMPALGDIDLRTDVSRYDVYRFGVPINQRRDISNLWQGDFAAFALGSSSTFEHALIEKGVSLRIKHSAAPMFRSEIKTTAVGPFDGQLVVSLRPINRDQIDKVRAVTARFPHAHGAPVHVGDPEAIGINDIRSPDWGEPLDLREGEVPVFWASGMTAQDAVIRARPEISIFHTPGHALVTDVAARASVGAFKVY